MKNTKTKLISSATVLLICFAMLIGSTFAWFTDSASTGVNKIQAGNLDVEIVNGNGDPINGLNWVKADGAHADEKVLWEPGATYKLPDFYVKNKGTLALKYKVVISGINGDQKLNEVIDWTIKHGDQVLYNSASKAYTEFELLPETADTTPITVQGTMKTTASNDYQGLSIDGITVTVLARQLNYEYDSEGNTYDQNSEYDLTVWDGSVDTSIFYDENNVLKTEVDIETAAQFAGLAKLVNKDNKGLSGVTINLLNDINLSNISWVPIGQTIGNGAEFAGKFNGNGHTISNLYINTDSIIANDYATGLFGWVETEANISNVKIENATVYGHHYVGTIAGYMSSTASITNCTVNNSIIKVTPVLVNGSYDNGDKVGGIVGFINGSNKVENCSISNTEIYGYRDIGGIIGYSVAGSLIKNNSVGENVKIFVDNTHNYKNYSELNKHDANNIVGENYGTLEGNSGNASISFAS